MVWPTLSAPPNALSLVFLESTTTICEASSAAWSQPPPNLNGTLNMPKKSLVVVRPSARNGATPLFGGASTTNAALRIITLRSGISDAYSACASRYVSSGGGSSGRSSLHGWFGSQLSSVTEYSTSLRASIGLPDISRYTVSVVI